MSDDVELLLPIAKEVSYQDTGRDLCVTGGCILTASEKPLGKAIRLFEGANAFCSHAASIVRFPASMVRSDRVTLIEALSHGLTPTYLSHYLKAADGDLYLFIPAFLTPEKQMNFSYWLLNKMFEQTEYDYASLGRQVLGHVQADEGALFCSEAWGMAAEYAYISRKVGAPVGFAPQPPEIPMWWDGTLYKFKRPYWS